MIPLCVEEGIGIIPWSPLARGFLAGNRRLQDFGDTSRAKTDDFAHEMYFTPVDFTIAERVVALASRLGAKPTQVALAWMLSKSAVSAPIVGASKLSHLDDAVGALNVKLTPEDVAYLEELYQPRPVLGVGPVGRPLPSVDPSLQNRR